jgi:hypothetical protein
MNNKQITEELEQRYDWITIPLNKKASIIEK